MFFIIYQRVTFQLTTRFLSFVVYRDQYIKNISASGNFVEHEIREMFRNILPKRFHVTHGYIVAVAKYKGNKEKRF